MADDLSTIVKAIMKSIYVLIGLLVAGSAVAGDRALPGHHPLTQAQAGSLLISELRCAACHAGVVQNSAPERDVPEKTAPELAEVGSRISASYLQKFLASPLMVHPGTTMPDLLASRPESERHAIAEALTHFLVAQSAAVVLSEPGGTLDRQQGKELYHSVGCVACHGPKEPLEGMKREPLPGDEEGDEEEEEFLDPVLAARRKVEPIAVSLEHVSAKYSVNSLSEFLYQPLRVRSSGRMPDMKLTPTESFAVASYLIGEQVQDNTTILPEGSLVEVGRKHFQELNCAACHAMPGMDASAKVVALKDANFDRGCLSAITDTKNANSPRFDLNDDQLAAIRAAIRVKPQADPDNIALAKTLTVFRCVACHVRDDFGGVHDAHTPYFQGSELNLGDDGRIPPPLTLMGAKLQATWMKKVLFDGESIRQYMRTRMPQYGAANLQHLPGLFHRLDVLNGPEMNIPNPESRNDKERQREKLIREAGRELLGDKGANCVACHQFNGKSADGHRGIDLLTSNERLQPEWFNLYLRNPGAFRPRTVMPTAWPDNVAAFTKILEGNTDRQIEAIWYYLSLGTSAADPSGIRAVSTRIEVGNQAVVYRGRSRIAGFRGIAVGLPEKLSYAFNAETGSLSAVWLGDFVGVNWSGQGSGDFNPASEPIALPQDVSFVALEDENSPWPLLPVMTKEAQANPNPLYPKNVGYQFRGYYLDELSIPTFQYSSGTIEIEDRTDAVVNGGQRALKRVLKFDSPMPQTISFRALVGEIHQEADQLFRSDRLRLQTPATETRLRSLLDEPRRSELLLRLQIPQGKSSLELVYEPLN